MKKIILLLTLLSSFFTFSQDFEGIIKYNITVKLSEKLQKASDEMNKPENKQNMQQLEIMMKDPQYQKMLESNPQMKKQLEAALKIQQGGSNGMADMMPKSTIVYVKGGSSLVKMEGGMNSEILYLKSTNKSYHLNRDKKTYYANNSDDKSPKSTLKAEKTTETAVIMGYKCVKYIVKDKTTEMIFWTTTEIKGIDYENLKLQSMHIHGQGIEGLDGITLKMNVKNTEMDMTMEVSEIKKQTVDASLLVLPSDFKEEKMPMMPMGK